MGECREDSPKPRDGEYAVSCFAVMIAEGWCGKHPDFRAYIDSLKPEQAPWPDSCSSEAVSANAQQISGLRELLKSQIHRVKNARSFGQYNSHVRTPFDTALDAAETALSGTNIGEMRVALNRLYSL